MSDDPLYRLLDTWSDAELRAVLLDRGASSIKKGFAREIIAERDAVVAATQAKADAAETDRAERAVRAAESQAAYAKRAFWISVTAIAISILALIVAAAQAAAQGMA